jgi:hypothetical protein
MNNSEKKGRARTISLSNNEAFVGGAAAAKIEV